MKTSLYAIEKETKFGVVTFLVYQKCNDNLSTATIRHTCPVSGVDIKRTAHGTYMSIVEVISSVIDGEVDRLKVTQVH